MIVRRRWWGNRTRPHQKISLSKRRTMATHVAMTCSRHDIQPKLPQIFIGNKKCFSDDLMSHFDGNMPGNVQFWQEKSSWNTSALMVEILEELAKVTSQYPECQFVLLLDVAQIHLSKAVIRAAADHNIWLLFVPPKCTWLLQPLDACTFSSYKSFLRNAYRDSKNSDGVVTDIAWASTLIRVASKFMCSRKWGSTFESTGVTGSRAHGLLTRDLRALEVARDWQLPGLQLPTPSRDQLLRLWPQGKSIPYWDLIRKPSYRRFRLVLV